MTKPLVLAWGIWADTPFAAILGELAKLRAEVVILDQEEILETEVTLTVDGDVRGSLRLAGQETPLEAVSAVYVRPYDAHSIGAMQQAGPDSPEWKRGLVCESTIACWVDLTPAFVVNRLSAMGSNGSKPYQASMIRAAGFDTPETLLTTDSAAAQDFRTRHGGVIYKSVSGVRSMVSRLTSEHGDRLNDIATCPTQFQEYVAGTDVRVHVVGDEVFACEIESSADDYRYALRQGCDIELRACEIPAEVADRCRRLAATLRLAVAGIDLRRRPDGRWYCFEVNPSPGFTYFETSPEHPIGAAIARLLLSVPLPSTPKQHLFVRCSLDH
jgi:hypothetical protein